MIRFVFRFLAAIALAVATIMAVLDATRSVAASRLVTTPLVASWQGALPASYEWAEGAAAGLHPRLWPILEASLLRAPGFAVFLILAFLLYAAGYRRPKRDTLPAFGR